MEPIISWIGNKEKEAELLTSLFPQEIRNYYEPFVGSGSVYLRVQAREYFINDRCRELAELYRAVKGGRERFLAYLESFTDAWMNIDREYYLESDNFISAYKAFRTEMTCFNDMQLEVHTFLARIWYENVFNIRLTDNYSFEVEKRFQVIRKFIRMNREEKAGGEYDDGKVLRKVRTALKASVYTYLQNIYNHHPAQDDLRTALFYFLVMYNTSAAYLLDRRSEFSVPYMGEKGNDRRLESRIQAFRNRELRARLNATYIGSSDYRTFLNRTKPRREDFIFLDPPEPGNYIQNGGWEFTMQDYEALFHFLQYECGGRWMMVVRNCEKLRDMVYRSPFHSVAYSKYNLSVLQAGDEDATHLILCNY